MRISFAIVFLMVAPAALSAQEAGDGQGKTYLLAIAVNDHINNRKWNNGVANTVRDAELVVKTLRERAGLPESQILQICSSADSDKRPVNRQPLLGTLRKQVPLFLSQAKREDRVILFYSGHGLIRNDKSYLIPADFDLEKVAETAYPTEELRTALRNCRAGSKFLILDCCHAGAAGRGIDVVKTAAPDEIARTLQPAEPDGTVIIASCKKEEESFEWIEKRQGIFTFWLCKALEGGADQDGDGKLNFENVYRYLSERVPATARFRNPRLSQTPVRIVSNETDGTPTIATLLPEPPESLCRRLAELLDEEIRHRRLKSVGVLEFVVQFDGSRQLARGALPGYCADRIRDELAKLAAGGYRVATRDEIAAAAKGLRVVEIETRESISGIAGTARIDALIAGALTRRGGKIHIQCQLANSTDGLSVAKPSGIFPLSEELLAENGASFDNRNRPDGSPFAPNVIERVGQQNLQAHPLRDAEFPYKIEIFSIPTNARDEITGKPVRKQAVFRTVRNPVGDAPRNEMLIGVRRNEMIEIHVTNNSADRAAMSLLVDGENTLGGGRQRIGEAWPWVLEKGVTYNFEGFYSAKADAIRAQPGKQGFDMRRFVFRDAAPLAGRDKFGDKPGLITAAFYEPRGRGVKLDRLKEAEERYLKTVDFQVGRLAAVVQIRYVDEESMGK